MLTLGQQTQKMTKKKEQRNEKEDDKENNYLDQIQRLQAEFDNFRKRSEKEKLEIYKNSNEEIITKLLNVLDSFELSFKHLNDKGVKMIYSELYSILEKEGLKKIKTGGYFNPKIHEALFQEKGDIEGKILEELQSGYTLNDKVIRVAKVKISKLQESKNE